MNLLDGLLKASFVFIHWCINEFINVIFQVFKEGCLLILFLPTWTHHWGWSSSWWLLFRLALLRFHSLSLLGIYITKHLYRRISIQPKSQEENLHKNLDSTISHASNKSLHIYITWIPSYGQPNLNWFTERALISQSARKHNKNFIWVIECWMFGCH